MSDTISDTELQSPNPRRWKAMPIIALAVSIIIMDATVVNVVLPVLIRDISLTSTDAEWAVSVYALVFAALLITVGRIGDLFGRRRLLIIGIIIFGAASILAALSVSGPTLIGSRLLQGVGAAMILPATLSTVNALFSGRERGIAFAIWGSTIGGMAAVGPLVGGWFATDFSWRWAFLINVPIAVIVLIGCLLWVPETKEESGTRGFDLGGVALSFVGMGAIVFALIEGRHYGWWLTADRAFIGSTRWPFALSPIPIAFAVGILALLLFVMYERRLVKAGKHTLLDLKLFGIRSFGFGSIAALIVALGEFGMLFALPLYLQGALGYSALNTGLVVLALAIGTFLISGASAQLTQRLGRRGVVRVGLLLEVIAVAGLASTITPTANGWWIAAWLFLYGVGVGMATAQLTNVILADVPVQQSGQASGLQSTVRQLGSALGIAILGTILVSTLANGTAANLRDAGDLDAVTQHAVVTAVTDSAGASIPEVAAVAGGHPTARTAAEEAMVTAARITTYSAAGAILLGLLATIPLPRDRSDDETGAEPPERRRSRSARMTRK